MELQKADLTFSIDTDTEDNPRLHNTTPTTDPKLPRLTFSDFCHNNNNLSQITVLQISNCAISEVPNSLQKLNLKQLIITHTNLSEVPSCLYSGLRSLELLDLSHNCIRNFHVDPACSSVLVTLKLSNNRMEDFPLWVLTTWCPNLKEVFYSGNRLRKLETARDLSFRKLEMCNSQLRDTDFLFLKKIKTLEVLDVGNEGTRQGENMFKDLNGLFTRFKWKNLQTLKLNNLVLSILPEKLFYVTSLIELHLVGSDLNWIPEEIRFLSNLKVLDVSQNGICSLPEYLTLLEKLSVVKASCNFIASVGEFHNELEILDLFSNKLENFVPCIERIQYIDLEENILDTSQLGCCDIYREKRDHFRKKFDLQRSEGPIELPNEIESDEEYNISEKFSEENFVHETYYDDDVDEECWDDEPVEVHSQRNPDVTPSDDEWNGREDVRIRRIPKKIVEFDVNEDWIFCDAENE